MENLGKTFFIGKKNQLQLSKSGGFLIKFRMGNLRFFSLIFFRRSLGDINVSPFRFL